MSKEETSVNEGSKKRKNILKTFDIRSKIWYIIRAFVKCEMIFEN
jgi:hypothetical protein